MLTKILEKLRKVLKLEKMLLIKLLSDYFSGYSRLVFRQFPENLIFNRRPCENDFGLVPCKIIFWKIVGRFLVNVRNIFVFASIIKYLLTGLLVPCREILSPHFLRTDLASSVHTSKSRA